MEPGHRASEDVAPDDEAGWVKLQTPPAGLPDIADYWPDTPHRLRMAPHRMGPPADTHELPGAAPTRVGRPLHVRPDDDPTAEVAAVYAVRDKPRRRAKVIVAAGVGVLVLVAIGLGVGRMITQTSTATNQVSVPPEVAPATLAPTLSTGPAVVLPAPAPTTSASKAKSQAPPPPATHASTTVPPMPTGTFWLTDDLTTLVVTTARLDQGVAQVSVPDGSNAIPKISMDGNTFKLGVGTTGDDGSSVVDVVLDDRIAWALRFGGGARTLDLDLSGGIVRSVAFERGVATVNLCLPKFSGTLPIDETGGFNTWTIRTVKKVDVSVKAHQGAGDTILYGDDKGGLGLNDSTSINVDGSPALDIDAHDGYAKLTVSAA